MVYIDETGFNKHLTEKDGYSPIGVDLVLPVKGSQGNSITFIVAICTGGLVAYSILKVPPTQISFIISFLTLFFLD